MTDSFTQEHSGLDGPAAWAVLLICSALFVGFGVALVVLKLMKKKHATRNILLKLLDSMVSVSKSIDIHIHPENIGQNTPHPILFVKYSKPNATLIETYVAVNPIGFSKNINSVIVYKALLISASVGTTCSRTDIYKDMFYGLKVVDDHNLKSILMLKEQVERSYAAMKKKSTSDWYETENLLEIYSDFVDEQSKKFCVAVEPHIPGSLRVIMKNKFSQGFPEDLILCVLRSVLKALKFLHQHKIMHKDINAGYVYLSDKSIYGTTHYLIKLGFAASVNEEEEEDENTPYLSMSSMSKWAAAPEVYNGNGKVYSEEADIWLVGIMALELAYGGLKVTNRNALEAMIKEISLPHTKKPKMFKSYVKKLSTPFSSKSKVNVDDNKELVLPLLSSSSSNQNCCPLFSKSFMDIVMQCLVWDPIKRPSVNTLLSQLFFQNGDYRRDGPYFYKAVMMNKTSS